MISRQVQADLPVSYSLATCRHSDPVYPVFTILTGAVNLCG